MVERSRQPGTFNLMNRPRIILTLWRERRAGRCKAPRRRRCGDIVEERQRGKCPPAAPLRAAARRPAGCVARSSHTTPYRSRLASGPGAAEKCTCYSCADANQPGLRLSRFQRERRSRNVENTVQRHQSQKADCARLEVFKLISRDSCILWLDFLICR